jgi:hypothetical protein
MGARERTSGFGQLEAIFHEALGHGDAEERNTFLNRACIRDGILRAQVDRLIEAHLESESD